MSKNLQISNHVGSRVTIIPSWLSQQHKKIKRYPQNTHAVLDLDGSNLKLKLDHVCYVEAPQDSIFVISER
jgi:hypothetical protein